MAVFKDVDRMPDFPAIEREILRFWEMERPFEALRERNAGGPKWSFVDGPITANNPMGVHHAWGRAFKDIFQRHRAMEGYDQRYQNGFDCQGLWVEVEVEKALGLANKRDILEYGLDKFSRKCRERVDEYSKVQTEQSKRLGQWMDWDHSYYTMDDANIEAIWHFLKTCHERGWLVRGLRSMPWCCRCGCSLSQHEQSNSYKELTHRAVFFKLPIVGPEPEFLLVWTTTPWTLAANVAAAVHPELDYVKVKQGDEILICAEGALKQAVRGAHEVVGKVKGKELLDLRYEGPIECPARAELTPRVIAWTDVGADEGTGIVHIAPGCGAEDYELSKQHDLPVLVPIDEDGNYYEPYGEFAGKFAHDVADQVFAHLEQRGYMLRVEDYTHRYPICWRCKEELVFRAVEEWFISVDEIRPKMKEEAAKVRWLPDYAGKRMQDWLDNMGDWCISRKRFWGLPLPFYVSEDGEELYVVGSRKELEELAGKDACAGLEELHRPWIDDITITSPTSGKTLKRIVEVGDCWLDAGIVFHSTLPYFEDREEWEQWFPAQFICEMVEQVRLWFYATLFMSVTLEKRCPYQDVLTYESVVAEDKTRFSKTGYNIPFDEAVEKMGADVMRWMYASAPVSRNVRFGYGLGEEAKRKLLTLWNVYAFFVTYANLEEPKKLTEVKSASLTDIDRWVLARLQQTTKLCRDRLENYDTAAMTREIEAFVDELSNWYVRLNRKRFQRKDNEKDKSLGFAVLYRCLRTLLGLLAPVLPFTTEKIYQNLIRRAEEEALPSIHLQPYPEVELALVNDTIVDDMKAVMQVAQMGHAARAKAQMKVRQPLREVIVKVDSPPLERSIATFSALLQNELNVKAVKLLADLTSVQTYTVKPNFKLLGRKYGKDMPKVQAAIAAQELQHREMAMAIRSGRDVTFEHEGTPYRFKAEELAIEASFAPHLIAMEEGALTLCLNTKLTPDLRAEGLARDAIRTIQVMRKDFNYRLGDKIAVQIAGAGQVMTDALSKHKDQLAREVHAESFELVEASSYPDRKEVTLGEEPLTIAIVRRF